jgi:hypothetical protein
MFFQKMSIGMDDICISPNSEFQLQAQLSMEHMVHINWQLVTFHGIGSGNLFRITMAEGNYLKTYQINNK